MVGALVMVAISGCSQPVTDELKIELGIDGKEKIKEASVNDKVESLQKKHAELLEAANWACKFSEYFSTTVKSGGSKEEVSASVAPTGQSGSNELLVRTSLALRPLEIPGQIFVCLPQRADCTLKANDGSDKQIQYPLALASLLRTQFGMKQSATLSTEYTERSKENEFTLKQLVQLSGDTLTCSSSMSEK